MASFSMEDFVGDGALKGLLPKLLEEGWDDVPTLKIMNSEDMNAINMSPQQKVGFFTESGFYHNLLRLVSYLQLLLLFIFSRG
jgi:hypothetical protein